MNLPKSSRPALIWQRPQSSTAPVRYSGPYWDTSATITTEQEPAAPDMMPARPPNQDAKKPMTTALQRPTSGETPATKAKATASGTIASETVRPARMFFHAARPPFGYTWRRRPLAFTTRSSTCVTSAEDACCATTAFGRCSPEDTKVDPPRRERSAGGGAEKPATSPEAALLPSHAASEAARATAGSLHLPGLRDMARGLPIPLGIGLGPSLLA
mmetsp:Transcript_5783/g.17063  ORF Transcript_5783/g.17063 Transcript_5783/m.17063 type:complete len:215 (+) Transcript_5783:361-1005(+)